MVRLSIGLWQVTQPADFCSASAIESPIPGDICCSSSCACAGEPAAWTDDASLPAALHAASPAQTHAASNKTWPNRRREHPCQGKRISRSENQFDTREPGD